MISRHSTESHSFPASLPVEGRPLASAKAGSVDRVEVLFDEFARLVLCTARQILRNPSEAEDVVQEVFLYIHRKSQLFDPARGSLKAWVLQIAISRALDRKLYLSKRGFYAEIEIDSVQLRENADLEKHIETLLARDQLNRAFSELTRKQRRTIESFYFEGLDLKRISEQLNEPLGSVRHHLYRGLQRLRKDPVLHDIVYK